MFGDRKLSDEFLHDERDIRTIDRVPKSDNLVPSDYFRDFLSGERFNGMQFNRNLSACERIVEQLGDPPGIAGAGKIKNRDFHLIPFY